MWVSLLPMHSLISSLNDFKNKNKNKIKIPIGSYWLNTPLSLPQNLKVKPRLAFLHHHSWNHLLWSHWTFTVFRCIKSSSDLLHLLLILPRSLSVWLFKRLVFYLSGFGLNAPSSNGYFLAALAIDPSLLFFLTFFLFVCFYQRVLITILQVLFLLQVCCLFSQR